MKKGSEAAANLAGKYIVIHAVLEVILAEFRISKTKRPCDPPIDVIEELPDEADEHAEDEPVDRLAFFAPKGIGCCSPPDDEDTRREKYGGRR